jgi:hypothetical protein
MYTAIRDSQWFTLPMTRTDEKIIQSASSFSIHYTAHYQLDDIDYEAMVEIAGKEDDTISFQFIGKAKSDFLSNRIGICTHHPLRECLGTPVTILQPDGQIIHSTFPTLIDPWPVFKQIKTLSWNTRTMVRATLTFSGDVFESEDQRNWSDASFKTYSSPVEIPFPVRIKKGDEVNQRVGLSIQLNDYTEIDTEESIHTTRYPFPKLGYGRSSEPLNSNQIDLLKQLIFDHYRVEIDFDSDWMNSLDLACQEAKALNTSLELIVYFRDAAKEFKALQSGLNGNVSSFIIMEKGKAMADPALVQKIVTEMKIDFPTIKIGAGTNGHFADINRNRDINPGLDFISYSVTPQAHLSDDLVMIENLEAQAHLIETLRSFTDKPIHISPVTLKSRDYPAKTIDERQHTEFAAQWTAICLKYNAGVDQITLFETLGPKGVLNMNGTSPVYDILRKIAAFKPRFIIKQHVDNPLQEDLLILENESGDRLNMEIHFRQNKF